MPALAPLLPRALRDAPGSHPDDRELLESLDDLIAVAASGDRRALAALAIGLGPVLLDEARTMVSGSDGAAADLVAHWLNAIAEGS